MTELWLIRHGQTDWNLEGRIQGWRDIPLNSAGLEQARQAAEKLDGGVFAALYSSPQGRARQTAEVLAARTGLPIHLDDRLRELNRGEWEGLLFGEVEERYPHLWAVRNNDPANFRPPGGETVAEAAVRMGQFADEVCVRHPGGRLLVVSHGMALGVLLCLGRRLPFTHAAALIPDNAEFARLTWSPA